MPQKLHLNSRWLTILAGIFAIIVLIKVGFDYWPEIKLLMHPTHEHRVMLTKMIRDHGAMRFNQQVGALIVDDFQQRRSRLH